jgi:hypothetical protein
MVISRENREKYKCIQVQCVQNAEVFVLKLAVHTIITTFQRANSITLTTEIDQQTYVSLFNIGKRKTTFTHTGISQPFGVKISISTVIQKTCCTL